MKTPFVIIGGGICGLTLANKLSAAKDFALVIEKSKGAGGRMATRRDGEAVYDHGAAFYTHSEDYPNVWHTRWQNIGKSKAWFSEINMNYFCGTTGMASLVKDLAEGQAVHYEEKVMRIQSDSTAVKLFTESGKVFDAHKIIMTCPLPQSLEILKASQISYPDSLKLITYGKALVGLFEVTSPNHLLNFNLLKPGSAIFTVANNQDKGISKKTALTVVMGEDFSDLHFDSEDSRSLQLIETELLKYFNVDLKVLKSQLKKWRYCQPQSIFQEKFISLDSGKIILAGDAFGGGSINGTISSANAVFDHLTKCR